MSISFSIPELAARQALRKLYFKPVKYWNDRLLNVCLLNQEAHGRKIGKLGVYSIHFDNRRWTPIYESDDDWLNFIDETPKEGVYCLPLHDNRPEFHDHMVEIAQELGELRDECHAAKRFISGLSLFPIPEKVFREILGDTLANGLELLLDKITLPASRASEWNENSQFSLDTFIRCNKGVATMMNQRILLNMIDPL